MEIKVFLADDHAIVRDGLCSLLEAEKDIRVIGAASNGRQAVKQVKKLNPEVVVMDIAMPELNGIEATRQIFETTPSAKVIILSMHSSKEHIFRALNAGAYGYLLKESAGKEMVEAVRNVHLGTRYMSKRIMETVLNEYASQSQISAETNPLEKLSPREREVLQLVVEGKSSSEIADRLNLSPKTVDTYRSRLMQKLGINDFPGLVKFAIRQGITTIDK
jgi:RNA polymerase sigma factor (sigma-70 family)